MIKFLLELFIWSALGGLGGMGFCLYMEPRYSEGLLPGTWSLLALFFVPLGMLLGALIGVQFFIKEPESEKRE